MKLAGEWIGSVLSVSMTVGVHWMCSIVILTIQAGW